ncbi:MAG: hypothetical protein IPK19_12880 [Chloroflexi bacterium]|nr:hypothetical protein [Chloroflexota bacterium]
MKWATTNFSTVRRDRTAAHPGHPGENQPLAREKLHQLINHRYSLALLTVITTNSTPGSRIRGCAASMTDVSLAGQVNISAPDYRNVQEQWTRTGLRPDDLRLDGDNFDTRTNASPDETA